MARWRVCGRSLARRISLRWYRWRWLRAQIEYRASEEFAPSTSAVRLAGSPRDAAPQSGLVRPAEQSSKQCWGGRPPPTQHVLNRLSATTRVAVRSLSSATSVCVWVWTQDDRFSKAIGSSWLGGRAGKRALSFRRYALRSSIIGDILAFNWKQEPSRLQPFTWNAAAAAAVAGRLGISFIRCCWARRRSLPSCMSLDAVAAAHRDVTSVASWRHCVSRVRRSRSFSRGLHVLHQTLSSATKPQVRWIHNSRMHCLFVWLNRNRFSRPTCKYTIYLNSK